MMAQTTLFGDKYRIHQFPRTQYLGSKEKLIKWILEIAPKNIKTVFDAFSGTSIVGYYFKDKGYKVYSNETTPTIPAEKEAVKEPVNIYFIVITKFYEL